MSGSHPVRSRPYYDPALPRRRAIRVYLHGNRDRQRQIIKKLAGPLEDFGVMPAAEVRKELIAELDFLRSMIPIARQDLADHQPGDDDKPGRRRFRPCDAIVPLDEVRRDPGIITKLVEQVVRAAGEALRLNYRPDDFAGWLDTLDPRLRKHAPAAFTAVPQWAGEMTQRLLAQRYLWTSSRDGWNPDEAARLRELFTAAGLARALPLPPPEPPDPGERAAAAFEIRDDRKRIRESRPYFAVCGPPPNSFRQLYHQGTTAHRGRALYFFRGRA